MAVKAKCEITLYRVIDIDKVTRYYLLQSSTATAPSKPTANPPGGNWKTTEPSYTSGSTNTLYFVDLTEMTNGSFSYSAVSKSSSYEAAKEAWNKANNAQNTADSANGKIDGLQIGGRNLISNLADNWVNGNWSIPSVGNDCIIWQYSNRISLKKAIEIDPNTDYWIKIYSDKLVRVLFRQLDSNGKYLRSTTEMLNQSWKSPSDCHFIKIVVYENSTIKDISDGTIKLKLEKGNKPTDYTPAPEDTEEKIETASKDAAKTATNYLKGSEDGLVVGNMTDEILGSNVLIDPDSVNIRYGNAFLARYSEKKIELGLNSEDSIIELCGGIGTISSSFLNNDTPVLFICSENIQIGKSITVDDTNGDVSIDTKINERYSDVGMVSRYSDNSAYIDVNASNDDGSTIELSVDGNDKLTRVYIRHGFNAADDYLAYEGVDIWTQDVVRFTNNKNFNHIGIGIGSGGINRGIHDTDYNHWMLYCDEKDLYYQAPETSKIRPYYRAGDSIQLYYQGAGFATSDGKYVVFTIPINKPIDASDVVASSVSGFVGRSNGKYTHGSASSTYVKPASYEAVINGNTVRVSMNFNNNTNVTNNAAIGVTWSGKITFN